MRLLLPYIFLVIICPAFFKSQVRVIRPLITRPTTSKLGIGVGMANSVVFLTRNTSEKNNALGLVTALTYGISKLYRVDVSYTYYNSIDIVPTWFRIKANTIEANLHVMFKSKGSLYFYPLFGLSYNVFRGYFTGKDDYLNLASIYQKNQNVTSRWLGVNTGIGMEYVVKPIVFFAGFKMRVGIPERGRGLDILDVCYTFGIRYNFVVPSIYSLFQGTRKRYFLEKPDVD